MTKGLISENYKKFLKGIEEIVENTGYEFIISNNIKAFVIEGIIKSENAINAIINAYVQVSEEQEKLSDEEFIITCKATINVFKEYSIDTMISVNDHFIFFYSQHEKDLFINEIIPETLIEANK